MECNCTKKIVTSVYETAEVGKLSINELKDQLNNAKFTAELNREYEEYDKLSKDALVTLAQQGSTPEGVGKTWKFMQKGMIKVNAMMEKSVSHYAEMMIQGTNMGIIDINKSLNDDCGCAEEGAKELGKRAVEMLNNNIRQLNTFL